MLTFFPALVLTILGMFLYGYPGYSYDQVVFLTTPKTKKIVKLRKYHNLKRMITLDFPRITRLRIPFSKPQDHLVLTHKPTKRQLRRLKKRYPKTRISYYHPYPQKKKTAAYSMVFTYKNYLVFFKAIPFSKQVCSIIDLSNEQNARLWSDIKSNKSYYQQLVTDNVRFHVNSQL